MNELYRIAIAGFIFVGFCLFTWKKPGWGFVLSPFAIIGMLIWGGVNEDIPVTVIAIFLFPVNTALVCWCSQGSPLGTPWYKSVAKVIISFFSHLAALVLMGYLFNVFGGILFILLVMGILRYVQVRKYSLALDIITTVGMSMRQSLPLPMALRTAAHGHKFKKAKIFTAIAHWLEQGYRLSNAFRCGYPKCPPSLLASITAAEEMNQLPETIQAIQADLTQKINDNKRIRPVHPWYPFMVLFFAFPIFLGLLYFIIPVFAEVLSDMSDGQAGLPWMTQILLDIADWLKGNHGLNILLVFFPFSWLMLHLVYVRFRSRNPQRPQLFWRIGDWLKWHVPIMHCFERNYAQLQLIEILKVGLKAGYPVNMVLYNATGLDMNHCYRKRLQRWLAQIEQGDNIAQAASKAGIGKTLAWAMDSSVNKGNTPLILESLEDIYRSRNNYRLNLLNSVACPLMVIGLGVCVGFIVTGMFLPIVKMIEVLL